VPETTRCVPVQTGVVMFSCQSSGNGTDHSSPPVFASRPTTEPFVIVTICSLPATLNVTGDA
jgi:hypothetical protein